MSTSPIAKRTVLDRDWQFSQVSSQHWLDVKESWNPCKVPTSVHSELKKLGKIPDPYKDLNEWEVQWIQEGDWVFKTSFDIDEFQLKQDNVDLLFDGLDTYCTIVLNGRTIATTENMFLSHRVSIKGVAQAKDNELELRFASPWHEARLAEEKNGGPKPLWNGASNRLYSRKAQYGWGWDWGPIIMTVGPWKDIHLETYPARIGDVRIDTTLTGSQYNVASLNAAIVIASSTSNAYKLDVTLKDAAGHVVKSVSGHSPLDAMKWDFKDGEIDGWYPRGYGEQPLYTLEIQLKDKDGALVDQSVKRVAFRSAKLVQEPLHDQEGTSFVFEINGIRVFCGGSNWIPADNFLTEIEPGRYKKWVELLVRGNQNMLRVWGGGVYEADELYDACDEYGILVWQDFMFGCGLYPSYPQLNDSIKSEAEQAVIRLRDHPSVVIFAGNNEDYALAESIGVMDYNDNSGNYMNSKFPARHIYEVLLPEVVDRLSTVFYHRSSPYGGKTSADQTVGDIHQWNVWHGTQEPWNNWDNLAGRFVSEFGMQGYPDLRTVNEWSDDKSQLFPQSRVSVNHNKADGFERRLELYLMENFRHAFDMPSYVYYTQIMQAECLGAAYRLWRRNFKGRGKEYTSGALVWQINDCWPCVSWAIADYYLRPKPAFFSIARELLPYTVGIARKDIKKLKDKTTSAFSEIHQEMQLWGCNSTLVEKDVLVVLETYNLSTDKRDKQSFNVKLSANASTEIWAGQVPGQPIRTTDAQVPEPIVVQARLYDPTKPDIVLARYSNWPEPWKYLTFPEPNLKVKVNGDKVELSSEKPIKGVVLDVEGEDAEWSDQALDLFPGDTQVVHAKGLNRRAVSTRYIGDGSA
ncbi:hypothetical protein CI109_107416 [Kwoniella shandongensis]|uniref:Beta-mannosidase B n=1 Tax=Kwoniella shandongensis TaxID=1734106 RepID=A0A5M6C0Z7_9TREE|nr:uncharacterized protein CI109_004655 [Kwoniella shandongensis]KAA5526879.1 hypothetical protein CI109_004655 [Kwoniella shandongensis]